MLYEITLVRLPTVTWYMYVEKNPIHKLMAKFLLIQDNGTPTSLVFNLESIANG